MGESMGASMGAQQHRRQRQTWGPAHLGQGQVIVLVRPPPLEHFCPDRLLQSKGCTRPSIQRCAAQLLSGTSALIAPRCAA
jgi:hypothetical protein